MSSDDILRGVVVLPGLSLSSVSFCFIDDAEETGGVG